MLFRDFAEKVDAIRDAPRQPANLEEFLCGMWGSILKNKDKKPTWEMFLQIISDAWTGTPMEFDDSWMEIKKSADSVEIETGTELDDFEYLQGTILYQIADLNRMRDAGYYEKDPTELFFGVSSPTGARWYNWSPESFISCAIAGMTSHSQNENSIIHVDDEQVTWRDLASLLYLGQMYE